MRAKTFLFNLLEKIVSFSSRIGINSKTPGALKVYNFLFQQSWPYGEIIEVQGSKMYVGLRDAPYRMRKTFEVYAQNRIHESATTELFKKYVAKGNTVVDLGANIGYFTLLAAKLAGSNGKVYAFEPEPENYRYLSKNIKINNYSHVQAFQQAVSNLCGQIKLYVCDYDTGHHTIKQKEGLEAYSRGRKIKEKSIDIKTITLDSFFKGKDDNVDIIKMDVEGAEALALEGMDAVLRKNKGLKMFVEFFPLLIEKMGNDPREFIRKLMQDYGFSIYIIPDDYDASTSDMKKLNDVEEVMSYRKKEEDHVNLFLVRE